MQSLNLYDGLWMLEGESYRPTIVCLCGSTRFKDAFLEANKQETLDGRIVLSVGMFPHTDNGGHAEQVLGENVKAMLDQLHKAKIDLADEIIVLNVGGYVGKSTKSEITYALRRGKPIRWLEPESADEILSSLNM